MPWRQFTWSFGHTWTDIRYVPMHARATHTADTRHWYLNDHGNTMKHGVPYITLHYTTTPHHTTAHTPLHYTTPHHTPPHHTPHHTTPHHYTTPHHTIPHHTTHCTALQPHYSLQPQCMSCRGFALLPSNACQVRSTPSRHTHNQSLHCTN